MEGLLHLAAEREGTEDEEELKLKLLNGSLFLRVKLALVKQGYKTAGPINSVTTFTSYAANNLWVYNRWCTPIMFGAKYVFGFYVPLDVCCIIGSYITGVKLLWQIWFYHKDAEHFSSENDLNEAMKTANDFAFTSRMTCGISFDEDHYDISTSYFSPCANLPRSGAQQMVRVRHFSLKSGFFSVADDFDKRAIAKPLGFKQNKELCLSREDFSMNILDD